MQPGRQYRRFPLILACMLLMCAFGCESTLDDIGDISPEIDPFTVFLTDDGLLNEYITDLSVDYFTQGIWCSTLEGMSYYSFLDSSFVSFGAESGLPNLQVNAVGLDPFSGSVFAGTSSGPAVYFDQEWFGTSAGDVVNIYITSIMTMLIDGSVWFGTRGGVSRSTYQGWSSLTAFDGLPADQVTSLAVSGTDVWIGTVAGIGIYDGSSISQVHPSNLSSSYVRRVFTASNGTVWCGTSNGINIFDGDSWQPFGTADGLPSPGINAFAEDRGGVLWVGTDLGLAFFDGSDFTAVVLPDEIRDNRISALAVDIVSGDLWIATVSGLVRYSY
jgi:ligand-binding sensor domain-containing protein